MSDPVEHPSHYQVGGFEVWDILDTFFPDDPHLWAAGKYLIRAGRKGDAVEDLEKCQRFLSRAISRRKEEDDSPANARMREVFRQWYDHTDVPVDVPHEWGGVVMKWNDTDDLLLWAPTFGTWLMADDVGNLEGTFTEVPDPGGADG